MNHDSGHVFWKAEKYHKHSSVQYSAAQELLHRLSLQGNEQILDVGCGDGKISAQLARSVPTGSVTGIDLSQKMIYFAQSTFSNHSNLHFLVQNAQTIQWIQQFDLIFSSFALQWVPHVDLFFHKAADALKPSGVLAITVPLGISDALERSIETVILSKIWSSYFHDFKKNWTFLNSSTFEKYVLDCGLKITYFETVMQNTIFNSREELEQYILQWFPYLEPIPQHLKQPFFKDIIDHYISLEPLTKDHEALFRFKRIDLIATKPIS